MSVCLESSSTLANQASSEKSENSKSSIVSTYPDEKEPSDVTSSDPSSNRNATKPLLSSSPTTTTTATTATAGNTLSSILQKTVTAATTVPPNNSLITVMNTQGPVAIVKSLNSPFPTNHHFTLVSSSPLTVSNGLGKQITVVPNPPYTLVRPQTNETVPMTVVQSSTTSVTEVVPKKTESATTSGCNEVTVAATVNNGSVVTTIPITALTHASAASASTIIEKPAIHNVFVKNSGSLSETAVANPAPLTGFGSTSNSGGGVPQAQKLLTATSFPPNNVLQNLNAPALLKSSTISKSIVPQQNSSKLKILGNVVVPTSSGVSTGSINTTLNTNNPNFVVNKTAAPVKYYPQQKVVTNANGTTKLLGKPSMPTLMKTSGNIGSIPSKTLPPPPPLGGIKPPKMMYPAQKGHIKTLPPLNNNNNNALKQNVGLKTIPPQYKGGTICGSGIPSQQVQRTSSGLRTIPPQRSPKGMGSINIAGTQLNKPNYIGKHAIQGQKLRSPPIGGGFGGHKAKANLKSTLAYNSSSDYTKMSVTATASAQSNQQMVYTQALTAQIIETLNQNNTIGGSYSCASGNLSGPGSVMGSRSRDAGLRYDGNYTYSNSAPPDYVTKIWFRAPETISRISPRIMDQKPQSGLDTLSLICQAVLLDHNYNATLPLEPVARPTSCNTTSPLQITGAPNGSLYSPGSGTRGRSSLASSNSTSVMSTSSSTLVPSMSSSGPLQDDDVASDISCGSERRPETEGEETDTAPEAEAVTSNDVDHYGDYVNRCVCGYDHDDGYMIECDRCKVWQHVRCVVKTKKVPEDFLCEICDSTKVVDRAKAQLLQQQYLKDRGDPRFQKDLRLQQKLKEAVSDSDSSDAEPSSTHGNSVVNKGRNFNNRKRDLHKNNIHQRRERPARRPIKKERKMTKRKAKAQTRQHHNQQQQHHHNSEDEKSTAGAIAVAADTWPSSQLPQLRQWIENYEEAVTNHYSPELRARVSNIRINGAHSDLTAQFDCSVHKCRVQTQPLTGLKLLVSTATMGPNTPIVELRGKYMLSTQHRSSAPHHGSGALNTRQHSQRPGPFLFFYRLHKDNTEVCVDTRTYGNDARFIRRSCKPNSELRHCIEKGVLHLYIVTIANVEKNMELTIKHESHDLAVVGTTYIACACGKPDECTVNKSGAPSSTTATSGTTVRRNGENANESTNHRKRRGRRTVSSTSEHDHSFSAPPVIVPSAKVKEEKVPLPSPPLHVKVEEDSKLTKEEKKSALVSDDIVKVKTEDVKQEPSSENEPYLNEKEKVEIKQEDTDEEEDDKETHNNYSSSVTTRRSSAYQNQQQHQNKSESSEEKTPSKEQQTKEDKKKLSREERKLEAIMKAFERMEKQQQRKQEHQAKQAAAHHKRESDPVPSLAREDDKSTASNINEHLHQQQKMKRRRRKGRARTTSTNSQSHSQQRRSNRVNSADSSYVTSSDETTQMLLSPNSDNNNSHSNQANIKESLNSPDKAAGLLLALANGDTSHRNEPKSPIRDGDSSSNSVHSSPETPLSSACLLVAAAVEPLEPGFKFPKTKKGLMNEWLNKSPECIQSASSISPSSLTPHITTPPDCGFYENAASFYGSTKGLVAFSQAASYCDNSQPHGNAKKRWLRQAISESPMGGESPPLSEAVAPPKKRKLPRESLSNDASPPTTPTSTSAPVSLGSSDSQMADQEGRVEIVLSGTDEDSPPTVLESDAVLKKRAAEMQEEFGNCVRLPESQDGSTSPLKVSTVTTSNNARLCSMDPRLSRHIFNNSDHLVGTVEKTLSIFGFQDKKPEPILPTKRKLSITEYRQRKKLTVNEKAEEEKDNAKSKEEDGNTGSTAYTSIPSMRQRSDSTSSATSFMSSDEELHLNELPQKPLSAFNSEPTELEKTRESVSLRLKKAFGLSVDEDPRKTTLNVEALLNCDLSLPSKTTVPLASPTFPIPGSGDTTSISTFPIHSSSFHSTEPSVIVEAPLPPNDEEVDETSVQPPPPPSPPPPTQTTSPKTEQTFDIKDEVDTTEDSSIPDMSDVTKVEDILVNEKLEEEKSKKEEQQLQQPDNDDEVEIKPDMLYSPDDEEEMKTEDEEEEQEQEREVVDEEMVEVPQSVKSDVMIPKMEKYEEVESTNYVPPFNNPLYPNSSTFSFGSVIDDDAPYEGRNPSPPPELSSNGVTGSYSIP
ncbi:inactive histone-lysine N-methyltransferase 2E isoform X2 [Agrilus planipennis]|uniref:Inactive histone-lysine N-methyltransferase 2E isoform X2 n=1 Tax=Agrilus planipennis TaxID=224129 RepID=A0A7F5R502_AGRPL|nr:inactive histone-lysine N-methyltransferase 2E isoform X2 [Agrilus planipennis]